MLQNAATFQSIAAALGKDPCTISREVHKHRNLVANKFTNYDEQNNVINESCPKLEKPPYVCNACKKRHNCRLKRYLYVSRKAHEQYRNMLRDSREGMPCSFHEGGLILFFVFPYPATKTPLGYPIRPSNLSVRTFAGKIFSHSGKHPIC